jgi:hypothetical protein
MRSVHVGFGLQHLHLYEQHVQEAPAQMDALVYQLAQNDLVQAWMERDSM